MYLIYNNEIDYELLEISNKYGGFADYLTIDQSYNRIDSIINEIKTSNLFEDPFIVKKEWEVLYTPEEFYGFCLTGNRFIQKNETEKKKAFEDIIIFSNKNKGYIKHNYLCVVYIAKRK